MQVRRRTIGLVVTAIAAAAALFFGCSNSSTSGPTELNFVMWKLNQPQVWNQVFDMFEAEHPDIKIKRQVGPHSSSAYHDLLTQKLKNADRSVDVFFMDVIWPPEFAVAGWAEPLDRRFDREERDRFLKGPILAGTYKSHIYGVPLFVDAGMLYYRKDLLEQYGFRPPRNWKELVRQAREIVGHERKMQPGLQGYSGQFKQYEGLVCNMMEFILSNGGRLVDPDSGAAEVAGRRATEAVRFVRDELIGSVAPRGVLTYEEPESLALFIQGKAVFMRNWPYAWEVSNNPEQSKVAGRVGVTQLPHFAGQKSFSALGGWQLGISRFSPHKEAAWTFIRFMTSRRIQKYLAVHGSRAPTRKALYEDPDVLKVNPQFRDMKEVFLNAYPRPRNPFYPAISNILQQYFSTAISRPDSHIEALARQAAKQIDLLRKRFPRRLR